jgi:protein O-mannosyl-transferase
MAHVPFRALLLVTLFLLTVLAYWPGLGGDFLFDDFPAIVSNSGVHAEQLNLETLNKAARAFDPGLYGRPLAMITFAIDHSIWGKDPWGYKLSSLIFHALNAVLVFLLVGRMLSIASEGGSVSQAGRWRYVAVLAIALLWAVHPLQVSTVLYVVQRMEILAHTFVLLGLLAYLRGRYRQIAGLPGGWTWIAVSALLALIGMLSKETPVLFPAYTLALELTLLRFAAKHANTMRSLKWAYIGGAAVALVIFAFFIVPHYSAPGMFDFRGHSVTERLLTQLRVVPMYLGQILLPLPAGMTFYYDAYAVSHGWFDPPGTTLGGLLIGALLVAALALRRRMPLLALGILWFFAAHLLTSNVIPLELVFEHRNYFALLGVLLAVADLVQRIPTRDGPAIVRVGVASVVVGFGALTLIRSATWGDPMVFATDMVAKNPNSTRASNDLATLYVALSEGNPDSPFFYFGMSEFERGSRLPGSSPLPEHGLILMHAVAGRPAREEWWDRLIEKIRTRPLGTQDNLAVVGLVSQRNRGLELDDRRLAEAYTLYAARIAPPAHVLANFGDHAVNRLRDGDLAEEMFLRAVEASKADPAFVRRMVAILIEEGHHRHAAAVIERAGQLGLIEVGRPSSANASTAADS